MNNETNSFLQKLAIESTTEFEKCIKILNSKDELISRKTYNFFLYNDLIQITPEIENQEIDVYNNSSLIIDTSIDDLYTRISAHNNDIIIEFKKQIIDKIKSIKTNIAECKLHINI